MKILFLSFTCEDIGVAMVTNIIFLFFIILEYKLFGTENISIIAWGKGAWDVRKNQKKGQRGEGKESVHLCAN